MESFGPSLHFINELPLFTGLIQVLEFLLKMFTEHQRTNKWTIYSQSSGHWFALTKLIVLKAVDVLPKLRLLMVVTVALLRACMNLSLV